MEECARGRWKKKIQIIILTPLRQHANGHLQSFRTYGHVLFETRILLEEYTHARTRTRSHIHTSVRVRTRALSEVDVNCLMQGGQLLQSTSERVNHLLLETRCRPRKVTQGK